MMMLDASGVWAKRGVNNLVVHVVLISQIGSIVLFNTFLTESIRFFTKSMLL